MVEPSVCAMGGSTKRVNNHEKQADHVIMNEVGYWERDDFKPIAEAIAEIFRQKGWL